MNNRKRAKINAYDLFLILFLLSLFLTAFLHVSDTEVPRNHTYAVLLISTEKSRGDITAGAAELYSHRAEIIGVSDGHILLLAEGRRTERGFLLGSTKYIFANHPLTVRTEDGYVRGRLERTLYPEKSDAQVQF